MDFLMGWSIGLLRDFYGIWLSKFERDFSLRTDLVWDKLRLEEAKFSATEKYL